MSGRSCSWATNVFFATVRVPDRRCRLIQTDVCTTLLLQFGLQFTERNVLSGGDLRRIDDSETSNRTAIMRFVPITRGNPLAMTFRTVRFHETVSF